MSVRHFIEVLCNFQFHVVGYSFILLYTRVHLIKCLLVFLHQQFFDQTEHALYADGKLLYLLLSLQYRELRSLHEASSNEVQTEVLLFIHFLRLDHPAYEAFDLWDKPDEDSGIDNIEAGVEGSQHKTEFGGIGKKSLGCGSGAVHIHIVANESADHIDERTEYEEYPYHTEDVEEHVCKCCTPRLCVGRHGSQV